MATTVLQVDTLDDRREIAQLIGRLPPARRLEFLRWACQQAAFLGKKGLKPQPTRKTVELTGLARWDSSANERLTVEVFMDLWSLAMQYNLNLDLALEKLVAMVRRP